MTESTNPSPSSTPDPTQMQAGSAHLSADTDKKVAVTAQIVIAKIPPLPEGLLEADFSHNYSRVMTFSSKNIPYLKVVEGRLEVSDSVTSTAEQEKVKLLLWQIYRQAAGKIFTARYGIGIMEEAMQNFNNLKAHFSKHLNEGFPPSNWHKPLAIFSETAGSPNVEIVKSEEWPLVFLRDSRKIETEKKVEKLRKQFIHEKPIMGAQAGVNKSTFVHQTSKALPIGVAKEEEDRSLGAITARMLHLRKEDIYEIDSKGKRVMNANKKSVLTPRGKKLAKIAAVNEMLASIVDIAFQGKLSMPLVARVKGKTVQAYVPNDASLLNLLEEEIEHEIYKLMPLLQTQFFVLSQLLFRNTDCHAGNILFGPDFVPIGIDMARILGVDPTISNFEVRAAYLDFPHLDVPIHETAKKAFLELNVPELLTFVKDTLGANYPELFADPEMKMVIEKNIETLEAHIYLLQEAMKLNCTLRQVIALHFRPVSENAFKSLRGREEGKAFVHDNGYTRAWKKSQVNGHLDPSAYKAAIVLELQDIKKYPDSLFGPRERQVYSDLGLYID